MGITKAADKCDACYKSEDCVLTVTMRDLCKGPFADRKEHVLALREYLLLNHRRGRAGLQERTTKRRCSFCWAIRRRGHVN